MLNCGGFTSLSAFFLADLNSNISTLTSPIGLWTINSVESRSLRIVSPTSCLDVVLAPSIISSISFIASSISFSISLIFFTPV